MLPPKTQVPVAPLTPRSVIDRVIELGAGGTVSLFMRRNPVVTVPDPVKLFALKITVPVDCDEAVILVKSRAPTFGICVKSGTYSATGTAKRPLR